MALAEGGHPEYMSESIHELNYQFLIFNSQFSIFNYQCCRHRENFIGGLAVSKKQGCFLGAGRYKEVRERSGNAAGIASSSPMVAPGVDWLKEAARAKRQPLTDPPPLGG
jgi:hypothetical protein